MALGTENNAIAVSFCFPIIGGILVALRFYFRQQLKAPIQMDDWLCLPAWLFLTGAAASLLTAVFTDALGPAPSSRAAADEQAHLFAQISGALAICWTVSNASIKLSILYFYRRIFRGAVFKACFWILFALSIVWFIYAFIAWILYCGQHVEANFEGPWTVCSPWGFDLQLGVLCLDSFIDLSLLILPIPFVLKLQMSTYRKVMVVFIFLLGGFAFVAGLNNVIVQAVLVFGSLDTNEGGLDYFQNASILVPIWNLIEIGVGLIASNLPSISVSAAKGLSRRLRSSFKSSSFSFRKIFGTTSGSSSAQRRSTGTPIPFDKDHEMSDMSRLSAIRSAESDRYSVQKSSTYIASDIVASQKGNTRQQQKSVTTIDSDYRNDHVNTSTDIHRERDIV